MEYTQNHCCGLTCRCDHYAPSERILRLPEFNRALAAYWAGRNVSIPALYDQILAKFYDCHEGTLFENGKPIDLYAVDAKGNDWIDRAFDGCDVYRTIHRYFERADGVFKNRLSRALIRPVRVMHFSREIDECAAVGPCSRHFAPIEKSAD